MPAIGSLRVELELDDGSFTTRIVRAGTSLRELDRTVNGTITSVRRLDSGLAEAGSAITKLTLTLGLAREAVQTLYTVFGQWGVSILKTAGEIQRLNTLLANMSGAITEVERAAAGQQATKYIMDLARTAPFALRDLTGAFTKLQAGGIEPMRGSMRSLTDAVAAFGGNSQSLDRAATAIQQMAGKGVISMEELRQQLGEAVPSALPLLARALGQTVDELVKNISDGKVRAEPALQALFAEFDRTFGGRSLALMNTFNGQIQQLQNTWQRLQTVTAGNQGDGGFMDRTTEAVKRLNSALQSPDAQSFGIRLGQGLAGAVDAFVAVAEAAYKYRDAIMAVGTALGGLLAFAVGRRIFSFLIAEAGLLAIQLRLAATAAVTTTVSLAGMASTAAVTGFGFLTTAAMGLVTSLAAVSRAAVATGYALVAMAISPRASLVALGSTIVGLFSSLSNSMAPAFSALATRLAATGTAATALSMTLRAALIGTGIVGAIFLIAEAVQYLIAKYNVLTRDAGAAYDRIRRGASDEGTIATARAEADALEEQVTKATQQLQKIEELRRQARVGRRTIFNGEALNGQGVVADVRSTGNINTNDSEKLRQAEEERIAFIRDAAQRIIEIREQAEISIDRRTQQLAENQAANELARVQAGFTARKALYEQQMQDLGRQREQVTRALNGYDDTKITPGRAEAEMAAVAASELQSRMALYQSEMDAYSAALVQAQDRLRNAVGASANETKAVALAQIAVIRAEIDKLKTSMVSVAQEGAGAMIGGGNQATLTRQAETALGNMQSRIAELTAQSEGLGGNLERITQIINSGKWGDKLKDELIASLTEAAKKLDEAEAKVKVFRTAQQALGTIDTGLSRSTSDLQGYIDRLNDPNMPEAQRRFVEFQRQMAAALDSVRAATNGVGAAFTNAQNAANAAVQNAAFNSALAQTEELVRRGEAGRIAALAPAARAREQTTQLDRQISSQREFYTRQIAELKAGAPTAQAAQQLTAAESALRNLDKARSGIVAGFEGTAGRAGASAGAKEENAITRLTARLAELKAEVVDGGSEYAKQEAILQRTGQTTSAYGQQVLTLARQIDQQTEALERARKAHQALEDIQRQGRESATRQSEYANVLADPNSSELNRQLINARSQMAERLRTVSLDPNQDQAKAAAEASMALRSRAGELALQEAIKQRDATKQIREGLAETNAERRRVATDNLAIETAQTRDLIAQSNLSVERKKQAEDQLVAYVAARNEQINRQTEGATAKMMREWSNVGDAMDKTFASALDGMADALTKFVMGGKLSFADLAKSIIADIIKIQIKAAASAVFNAAGGASGLSSLFSGGNGSVASAGKVSIDGGLKTGLHSGGISGTEATFTRMVSNSHWDNAPRYHTGIGPDEQAAILQKGEGVFTKGQMAAIGDMNRSYQFVEGMLGRMASAMEAPASIAPAGVDPKGYAPSGGNMPPITINMINQTNQPATAMGSQPKFDGEKFVMDIVIKGAQNPGPMRDALRGV